jgi:hypothetical protein
MTQNNPKRAGLAGLDAYQNALGFYRLLVAAVRRLGKGHVVDQVLRPRAWH